MVKGAYLAAIIGAIVLSSAVFVHYQKSQSMTEFYPPQHVRDAFITYKAQHDKAYATPKEEAHRLMNFWKTYEKVRASNSANKGYVSALNKFSDMAVEEFKAKYLGYRGKAQRSGEVDYSLLNAAAPANDVDWRTQTGVVTPVKDQKQCGSCWAFSTTGAAEGAAAIFGEQSGMSFSEQQLVDCSSSFGNDGCNGGLMENAFKYIHKNGITTDDKYPYTARDQSCKTKVGVFKVAGYKNVPEKSSGALAAAIAIQPISIAIEADEIMTYSSGVFDDTSCGRSLDHGVLLVGYTADSWIVKNSWGPSWGEKGFIRFSKKAVPDTKGGICGILMDASFPTV